MKLYKRLIKPVLCIPDRCLNTTLKDIKSIESPVKWYGEEEADNLKLKYDSLNDPKNFQILAFESKFVEVDVEDAAEMIKGNSDIREETRSRGQSRPLLFS